MNATGFTFADFGIPGALFSLCTGRRKGIKSVNVKYLAGLLLALLCLAPALPAQNSFWDSKEAYLAQPRPTDTPQIFAPGLLADPGAFIMDRVTFSLDGKEFFYTQNEKWFSLEKAKTKVFKYDGHKWTGPAILNEHFYAQTFSLDGNTLYFSGEKGKQVLMSRRTENGWTAPAIFLEASYPIYDFMPTQSGTFYLATVASPDDKKYGIDSAFSTLADKASTPKSLGRPLNEPGFNGDFYVAPDESYIIISAKETKTYESELYISFRKSDSTWTEPVSLGPKINDGLAHRWGQYVTPDGKYLFYTRATSEKDCAIYWVRFDNLLKSLSASAGQTSPASQTPPAAQTFPLSEISGLVPVKVEIKPTDYKGRKAVRVTSSSNDDGFAVLPGTDFQDGTIEADVALKVTTPPGVRMPGFVGIAFRARPDASHYDLFYIRPGNSHSEDQAMRNHSVQYVAVPDFDWNKLRRQWPYVYESHAELQFETWTPIKIEVHGRTAKLFLNKEESPTLVVNGLKGEDLHGAVALWGNPGEEAYFSNVRIINVAPEPIKNGSDAAGAWRVNLAGDTGAATVSMKLVRDGNKLTGTVSGDMGNDLPVQGMWRDGYLELTFPCNWAKGAPTVTARLAGWIDGDSAQGRMQVEKLSDGTWKATRQ